MSIVVYDLDTTMIKGCIASLEAAVNHCRRETELNLCEVSFIDNGQNGSPLKSILPEHARLIQNATNTGFGSAHNQVIETTQADYHLILNPDVILDESSLTHLLALAEANRDINLICPKALNAAGLDGHLAKRFPSLFDLFLRGFMPEFVKSWFHSRLACYEYQDIDTDSPNEVELVSGCCMFTRTEALKRIGGFDERFFLYFEDFDLSLRMGESGSVVYAPGITIKHYGGNTSRKGWSHIGMFVGSAVKFYQKHGWRIV